ncbi:MAG: redoxin domain-containing protein [Candidatus Omnitrophica bacterium]|nr:redoxin domain-containing protein [Candidatus Omnitrophota bacterium]MDD5574101.1 redoxin domain-containing protein [Candidatus Omnitrophota bacterium]
MAVSLVPERKVIPLFHLEQKDGEMFDSSDYKRKKNLVLFFLTDADTDFLMRLSQAAASLRKENAEIIAISLLGRSRLADLHRKNHLDFVILSDEKKEVFRKFLSFAEGESFAALFVTDRYGDVFFQYVTARAGDMPPFNDIARSLVFIESQCPECGGWT